VNGIDKMRPEYYKARGWSAEGVPSKETLARLGL
jgi:aldehyde:ferredoxin oxidoreductase